MLYIIVNPASKSGLGKKQFELLKNELNHRHIVYDVWFTKKGQGAKKCVSEILERMEKSNISGETLAVLGGDGTINEVINALPSDSSISIAYLPTGSSNDLARALHISADMKEFVENYKKKSIKKVDSGVLTNLQKNAKRRFMVSCGMGFDAAVCKAANSSSTKNILNRLHLGKLSYAAIALRQIFTAPMTSCRITLADGSVHNFEKVLFIVAMVHPYEGGGIKMCPMADSHDGLFDVLVVSDMHRFQALYLLPLAFFGLHTKAKPVHFLKSSKLTVELETPLTIHTDGEYAGTSDHIFLNCKKDNVSYL